MKATLFSDGIFSFVGLGRCLENSENSSNQSFTSDEMTTQSNSIEACSANCVESMSSNFQGFSYNHATQACSCHYSDHAIQTSDTDQDFEICFRYVGTWPTSSPTISPQPTASPTIGPTLTPSAAPSSPPTLRPSQPPLTNDGVFELEGLGRCLDAEGDYYGIEDSSDSGVTVLSADDCGSLCLYESTEYIVGFELTPGQSCHCLVSDGFPRRRLTPASSTRNMAALPRILRPGSVWSSVSDIL